MDHGDAEFYRSSGDEDFLNPVKCLVDLFMHDVRMGKILNEYHVSIPDLAMEMKEMYLRLWVPRLQGLCMRNGVSIVASYAEDVQMKST